MTRHAEQTAQPDHDGTQQWRVPRDGVQEVPFAGAWPGVWGIAPQGLLQRGEPGGVAFVVRPGDKRDRLRAAVHPGV